MALRREDVPVGDAIVLAFPSQAHALRARRRRAAARRRRSLAAALLGCALVGLSHLQTPSAGGPSPKHVPAAVVVQPGQTLWDLAARYAPRGSDPRAYLGRIARLNRLQGEVAAGARLRLPGAAR